ncbi:MAG: hypothetical protein KC933_16370 [Myxococcales bacterium]|nr:hypothetical protein [Myxococcales bacterium]
MSELGDIQTLVVLMFENRSFDNVLGHLSHPRFGRRHDIDGLGDPSKTIEYDNYCDNEVFRPCPTRDGPLDFDLPHDRESIAQQMDLQNGVPTMGGFVEAYRAKAPDRRVCSAPMSFLRPQDVPSTGFIAEHFAVCDRWFSPIASGTQPNRAMAFTGSSRIDDNLDLPVLKAIPHRPKELVFRWLSERRVPWRAYHSGLSFFSLFGNVLDLVLGPGFRNVRSLHSDMLKAPDADDPRVIFIEPEYGDSPVHLATPNDNHPPLVDGGSDATRSGGLHRQG